MRVADRSDALPEHFLPVKVAAYRFFGDDSAASRARIIRLADGGEIACIRVGERGDRLIPASEIERLQAKAHSNLRSDR